MSFVLPSPVEPFRTLYQAGPNGIILSLEEIPSLLSLPAMKLPAQGKPPAKKKKPRAGIINITSPVEINIHAVSPVSMCIPLMIPQIYDYNVFFSVYT